MILKSIKFVIIFMFILIFIVSLMLIQVYLSIDSTVFSSSFFENNYDKNDIENNISLLVESSIDNIDSIMLKGSDSEDESVSPELQYMIDQSKAVLKENIDSEWVGREITKIIKGTYSYFVSDAKRLPILDVKPVIDTFINVYTLQIIEHSGESIEKINLLTLKMKEAALNYKKGLNTSTDAVNQKELIINELMKHETINDADIGRNTVDKAFTMVINDENIDEIEILELLIRDSIIHNTDILKINEGLDFNMLLDAVYESENNPISGAAILVNTIKENVLFIILSIMILTALIIITAYHFKLTLSLLGMGMIIAGIPFMIVSFLSSMAYPYINEIMNDFTAISEEVELNFIKDWFISYFDSFAGNILTISAIICVLGVIMLITALVIPKRNADKKTVISEIVFRLFVFIALLVAIPMSVYSNVINVKSSINEYTLILEQNQNTKSLDEALNEVLNTNLFTMP